MSKWWLFRKEPEPPRLSEQLELLKDDVAGVARGLRRVQSDLGDLQEEVGRRFGKLWGRLKASKTEEAPEEAPDVQPPHVRGPAGIGTHSELSELRRRHVLR